MNLLSRRNRLWQVTVVLLLAGIAGRIWLPQLTGRKIDVGQVYLRAGLPDSAMVAEILATAPNEAGYLMVTILAYDRLVRIDQIGTCAAIRQRYDAAPAIIPIPVHLPDHESCFAYRIRFDIPMPGSDSPLPLTVAVIHPAEDRRLLHPPTDATPPNP